MTDHEPIEVDFKPDGVTPERSVAHDVLWGVVTGLAVVLAVALFIHLLPILLAVLVVAAVLAALSTWATSRRRAHWRERFGQPTRPVNVKTYSVYLAAWFCGILLIIPILILAVALAAIALVVAGIAAIVLLVASLFNVR